MKGLRILFFLIAIVVVAGFILNYISPNEVSISESIQIDGSPEVIYSHVSTFTEMSKWHPWAKKDPNTIVTMEGEDGTIGSYSTWKSDHKDVGSGKQEFTKLIPNSRVETALTFTSPHESEASSFVQLDQEGDGTKVTWNFGMHAGFPLNIFMKFNEDMMRDNLKEGLNNLKSLCSESPNSMPKRTSAASNYSVDVVDFMEKTYLIKREKVSFDQIAAFYQSNMPALYTAIMGAGGSVVGAPSGLFFEWDVENSIADMAVAIPIGSPLDIMGYQSYIIEAHTALKTRHIGPYEKSAEAHYAIDDYMKANAYDLDGLVIEEYVNDPSKVASSDLQTDVYYLVKKAIN